MKIEIHHYYHYGDYEQRNFNSCDLGINNGNGCISYHDWNVKQNKICKQCEGKKLKGYYLDKQNFCCKSI